MIAIRHERTGHRIARLFRKARDLPRNVRGCDLDGILASDSIDVQESWCSDPGYCACLVQVGSGIPPGVLLAAGQSRGRRRFSIAHELGHLYIPTHSKRPRGWCSANAMAVKDGAGDRLESEANDFAAELLMPQHLIAKDAALLSPSFASITKLASADHYDVSVTAAAVRYVDVTRSACALVCSQDGVIRWVLKSESFVYRIPWRDDRLPKMSLATSELVVQEPQELAPHVWLELAQRRPVELFESTHRIPSQRQTLSLVWVEDGMESE